jgi:hypothetical protein
MTSKRKCEQLLSSHINRHESAEMAILHLMDADQFRPSQLQDILNGLCISAEGGSISL